MIEQPLEGQIALVTGAASGIGAGVARSLGAAGASVAINYVTNPEAAETVAGEVQSLGGKALTLKADVSSEEQVGEMFRELYAEWGTIDILVNNAGLQKDAAFTEMTLSQWNTVIGVNLTGMFLCAREATREMVRRGVRADVSRAAGKIICMSSVHEVIPWAGHVRLHAVAGPGDGAVPDSRQLDRAGRDHDAHQPGGLGDSRGARGPPDADPLRAHRRARGHRQGRGLPCLRRLGLYPRADPIRGRGHDLVSRVRTWRIGP